MKKILIVDVPDWATGYNVTLNGGVIPNITAHVKEFTPPSDEEIKKYATDWKIKNDHEVQQMIGMAKYILSLLQ